MPNIADYNEWKSHRQQAGIGAANVVLDTLDQTPDAAAADMRLGEDYAKATGAPTPPLSLVRDGRTTFEREVRRARDTTALSSSPMLAEWLRNPENAAVSADDLGNLSFFGGLGNALDRGVRTVDQSVNQLTANSVAQRYRDQSKSFLDIFAEERANVGPEGKIIDAFTGPITDLYFAGARYVTAQLDQAFGNDTEAKAAAWQQRSAMLSEQIAAIPMTPEAEAIRQQLGGIEGDWREQLEQLYGVAAGDPLGFLSFVTQTAVEFAPAIAASIGVTAATRNPTAGAAFLGGASATVGTGTKSLEWVEKAGYDLTTPEGALAAIRDPSLMADAMKRGQLYGLTVGIMDGLSGGVAGATLSGSPVGNMVLQLFAQAGLGSLGEAGGQLVSGQDLNWVDIVIEGVAEFVTAPLEVAGLGHARWTEQRAKANAAEGQRAVLEELSGRAQESRVRERTPTKFREWVDQATKDGPVADVFVPAEAWVTYWQSRGIDPHEAAGLIEGVSRDDLDTALATGGDLKIPTASYAAAMAGSEHDAFMLENAKFDPSEFSSREAAEFNARAREALEEAYDLADAVRRDEQSYRALETQIHEDMVSRLRAVGRAQDVATTEAALYPAFYRTMAERSGISTEEFLERYPLPKVRGDVPEGLKLKSVDALTRTLAEARNQRAAGIDSGQPLLEFIAERGGINDIGGELAARDAEVVKRGRGRKSLRLARKGFVAGATDMFKGSASNHSPDDVARAAVEAGLMADDPTVLAWKEAQRDGTIAPDLLPALWAGIDRELRGEAAAGPRDDLGAIEEYLATLGRSLDDDDADIRAAIEADQAAVSGEALKRYGQAAFIERAKAGIRHLIDLARGKGNPKDVVEIGPVSDAVAAIVKRDTGVDISGFQHSVDVSAVRHILNRHADTKGEAGRGQMPVTDEDITAIPELIAGAEKVITGLKTKRGQEIVAYVTRAGDGSVLYLEEARVGRKRLAALSMRKMPPAILSDEIIRRISTSETPPGDMLTITDLPPGATLANVRSLATDAGVDLVASETSGTITLNKIVAASRGQGAGSRVMQALADYADAAGKRIVLTPSTDFGGSSVARLTTFYKRFGFVENKGRSRDFSTRETMIREPRAPRLLFQADGSGHGTGAGLSARGAVQFPAVGIGRGETVISLFKSADLSTMLHESGHYFLAALRDMAATDPAGPVAADLGVVGEWWRAHAEDVAAEASRGGVAVTADDVRSAIEAGTAGDTAKDGAIDVAMHEQFARAFEQYLMEGKAPSLSLRAVFEKFRAWLISIYRNVAGLGVDVSPALRGVFDRMLATDAELAAAREDAADAAPIFASAEQMGLAQKDYDVFRALHQRGQDEAAARLLAEIMAPIRRAATKEYREQRNAVRADVEKTLKATPVYRAIQELRFGRDHDGEEVPTPKLSREAIERDYGAGWLAQLPGATKDGHGHRNAVFANEDGAHPDLVAGMYGFETGEKLLDALAKAPPLKDAIEAETERFMAERFSDPLRDGSIPRAAMDALHNDARGQSLAQELRALNDVAGLDRGITWKDARESARRTIRDMKIRDAVRADRFLAAERRAGANAQRLAATVTRSGMWLDAARRRVANLARAAVRDDDAAAALRVNDAVDRANAMLESKDISYTAAPRTIATKAGPRAIAGGERTAHVAGYNENAAALVEAKRQQLLNHALYEEARKAGAVTDRLLRKTQRLARSYAKQSAMRDIDYIRAARAVAARFGLVRAESDFDFAAWLDQLRHDDPVSADAISHAVETYSQNAKPYRDLTVAEFDALKDAVDSLLETAKRTKLLEIEGKSIEREAAITDMLAIVAAREPEANAALRRDLTGMEKFKDALLSWRAGLTRMENWARDMDDGKAGMFTRYLVRPMMEAVGAYRLDKAARLRQMLDIIEPRKSGLYGRAIDAPELGYIFTSKANLIHAILHTGNESNLEKLLLGRGWSGGFVGQKQKVTPAGKPSVDRKGNPLMDRGRVDTSKWDAFVARMVREGIVTKADYDMAQAIWDLMEEIKRPAQSAHRRMFGYSFSEIEPRAVDTPFGLYRGGYVPAIADPTASNDGQLRADQAALDQQQSSAMFPTTGRGFTKSRVQNYRTPLALDLMLLPAHMDKVLRFTHVEPVVRQTAGLVMKGELRDALNELDPGIVANMIVPWLQRTGQQMIEIPSTTPAGRRADAVLREIRKRVGLNMMFANLVNTAQQVTGLSSAMVLVKPGRMSTALIRFTRNAGAMRKEAVTASPFMRDRIENSARELSGRIEDAIVKPGTLGEIRNFAERHGYFMQQAAQNVADVITWHAAFDQAVAGGMDNDAAVFEADSVIRRTMGDFSPENLSKFEVGSALQRVFTMFVSYFNGQANLIGYEMATAMRDGDIGRLFWIYLVGLAVPAIVAEAIVQAARGELGDEDDDGYIDDLADLFFGSQLRYVAAAVPVVGNLAVAALNRFNDKFYDDRVNVSPALSMFERTAGAGASVVDAAGGDGKWSKAIPDSLYLLGLITGIPTGQLAKWATAGIRAAEGE